jgi:hypothetical protein
MLQIYIYLQAILLRPNEYFYIISSIVDPDPQGSETFYRIQIRNCTLNRFLKSFKNWQFYNYDI